MINYTKFINNYLYFHFVLSLKLPYNNVRNINVTFRNTNITKHSEYVYIETSDIYSHIQTVSSECQYVVKIVHNQRERHNVSPLLQPTSSPSVSRAKQLIQPPF